MNIFEHDPDAVMATFEAWEGYDGVDAVSDEELKNLAIMGLTATPMAVEKDGVLGGLNAMVQIVTAAFQVGRAAGMKEASDRLLNGGRDDVAE